MKNSADEKEGSGLKEFFAKDYFDAIKKHDNISEEDIFEYYCNAYIFREETEHDKKFI